MKYKDFYTDELNEDPEVLMGEYPRWDYDSYLFIGTTDGKGLIYTSIKQNPHMIHGNLMRAFVKKIDQNGVDVKTIGDVADKQFSFDLSGAVIPKQTGIEKTLISLWDKQGLILKPILRDLLIKIGVSGAASLEVADRNDKDNSQTQDF